MAEVVVSKFSGKKKPKILVFCDYFLPGYKSGGGMRTIVNMIDRLHNKYDFWVVTRDHDGILDLEQYKTVEINRWNRVRNAQVFYLSKDSVTMSKIREVVLMVKPDLYYANSFFATLSIFLVRLRKLRRIPYKKIVIAPCGELSEGSLHLKFFKKWAFLKWSKLLDLYRDINWKASSELEKTEIHEIKGIGGEVFIAPDLPPRVLNEGFCFEKKPEKKEGSAKMIFLSRFTRKKNFKWFLDQLYFVKGELLIDIYGPLEDHDYWKECAAVIEKLPGNIIIESKGPIPYEDTAKKLLDYHFFVLPTLSENFGHVFLEALAAGCPLLISDRTPWLNLQSKGIGWDLPLEKGDAWIEAINACLAMESSDFKKISKNARNYATKWLANESVEKQTIELLNKSLTITQTTES